MEIAELTNKLEHALRRIEYLESFIPRRFERLTAKGFKSLSIDDIKKEVEMSKSKYDGE